MARYNTTYPVTVQTGTASIDSPNVGLFTTLTGTAPYTITLPSPTLFSGADQSFFNNTAGVVTLTTPAGTIRTAGADATTYAMPAGSFANLASNGTDYLLYNTAGGPVIGTTATFTGTTAVTGTSTFSVGTGLTTLGGGVNVTGSANINGDLSVTSGQGDLRLQDTTGGQYVALQAASATTTYTITLPSAVAASNDLVLTSTSGGVTSWSVPVPFVYSTQSTSFTASASRGYFVVTSGGAVTATLPSSPAVGNSVRFLDAAKTFDTNALTIARNGQLIQGDAANMTVNSESAAFELIYSGATYGWRIFSI